MEKRWIWPFELEEQIGSGAMGLVYRARFVKNDRRVALKLLPPDVAANPTLAARFQREMELLKDLRHPNIVHCFGGTCEGDQWFYAMELVEGGTLASLIQEQGRLPWRQTAEFGMQMCAALEYAHERGIVHRDVKPGNMLITKSGKLKLSDFGLAQMQAENKLTAAGKTVGSLHYMAPEQITGKPAMSSRTDLYALGCVLYETLTGRPPFVGGTMAEVLQRHTRDTAQPVASIALDCPPQFEALIAELLAKHPDQRPPDAATVARRLREIDSSVTIKVPRADRNRTVAAKAAETISVEIQRPKGWGPANYGLIAGLVVLALIAAGLFVSRSNRVGQFDRARTLLTQGLRDANPLVRVHVAKTLGEIGPDAEGAAPALLESLHDDDPTVRVAAAEALAKIGGPDLQAELRKVQQNDAIPQVRDAAATALKDLKEAPQSSGWSGWTIAILGAIAAGLAGAGYWVWKTAAELKAA